MAKVGVSCVCPTLWQRSAELKLTPNRAAKEGWLLMLMCSARGDSAVREPAEDTLDPATSGSADAKSKEAAIQRAEGSRPADAQACVIQRVQAPSLQVKATL